MPTYILRTHVYDIVINTLYLTTDNKMKKEYVFFPMPRANNSILNTIQIGDSLIKEEESELFILKKNATTFYEYEIFIDKN